MSRYFDISIPTSPRTTVYPGDPAPAFEWPAWSMEKNDPANVGFFHGGLHHGTHVDAPWHFVATGKKIDEMGLEPFIGPCQVVDAVESSRISADFLESARIGPETRRLLFKTRNSRKNYWEQPWDPDFVFMAEDAARWCVDRGMRLVGLDYLTIDPPSDPSFPAHRALLGNGTVILENINLRDISPGTYELLAAPVHLVGVDGAWTRALLRSISREN